MTAPEPAVHCPTCGGTWGVIATYQCDGPSWAPHPRVRTRPGPPPLRLALVQELAGWLVPDDSGWIGGQRIARQQAERMTDRTVLPIVAQYLQMLMDLAACGECSALTRPDDADEHAQWHQLQRDGVEHDLRHHLASHHGEDLEL